MSSFTSDLSLLTVRGSKKKMVLKPFRYWLNELHKGPYILIPFGFWTDGASIPRFAWPIVGTPFESDYLQGAVLHDYLYYMRGWCVLPSRLTTDIKYPINRILYTEISDKAFVQFTQKGCDMIFRDSMKCLQTPDWKRGVIFYSLRLAGWMSWNNHKKRWIKEKRHPLYELKSRLDLL